VVLWEMLTSETPYKGLEDHQVIFGVGSNKLSLPIPATCPQSFKQLLQRTYSVFLIGSFSSTLMVFTDRTAARGMISYWHDTVIRLPVCL